MEFGDHAIDAGTVGGGSETDEEGHEVELGRDKSSLPFTPLEGVLFVVGCELEFD